MKVRHLKQQLSKAGFSRLPKRGKGSHQIWQHYPSQTKLIQSGRNSKEALPYQVKAVRCAIRKINYY